MFRFFSKTGPRLREMTAAEVHDALARNEIALVDVRETAEFAAELIPGALSFPLSRFDPASLPSDGRPLVLHCLSGKRSAAAVAKCFGAGVPVDTHMKGGIAAWKQAGYPTRRPE